MFSPRLVAPLIDFHRYYASHFGSRLQNCYLRIVATGSPVSARTDGHQFESDCALTVLPVPAVLLVTPPYAVFA
jgi:hypothetical protein